MTDTTDIDPPDFVDDWAIAAAQTISAGALDGRQMVGAVAGQMRSREECYQLLCTLSRTVGVLLRPTGHPGGPIGTERLRHGTPRTADEYRVGVLAAQLIGFAASIDVAMVRAFALTASNDRRHAQRVAVAMLQILTTEPRKDNPNA